MWSAFGPDGPLDEESLWRMAPPDNEIPVAVPLNALLARTEDAALAILTAEVYSTGVSFDMVLRAREPVEEAGPWGLDSLLWQHGPHRSAGPLLLGVELADGTRVSNAASPDPVGDFVFTEHSGSGGQRGVEQSWWLSPLPPEGQIRVVVRCAALGIEETATVLNGTAIRRAAEDVVVLWPWTPPDPGPPESPPPPDLPPDSWFAGSV